MFASPCHSSHRLPFVLTVRKGLAKAVSCFPDSEGESTLLTGRTTRCCPTLGRENMSPLCLCYTEQELHYIRPQKMWRVSSKDDLLGKGWQIRKKLPAIPLADEEVQKYYTHNVTTPWAEAAIQAGGGYSSALPSRSVGREQHPRQQGYQSLCKLVFFLNHPTS